jgi:chromosomal replication initiation ATPase DnaA
MTTLCTSDLRQGFPRVTNGDGRRAVVEFVSAAAIGTIRRAMLPAQINALERLVTETFPGITSQDLRGRSRKTRVCWPRQIWHYLIRQITEAPVGWIGNQLGFDHATILHNCRMVRERAEVYPDVRKMIKTLLTRARTRLESDWGTEGYPHHD